MPDAAPDTTLIQMFWTAHIVVKIVMLGLLAASFWGWVIIVDKVILFRRFRTEMDSFRADVLVRARASRSFTPRCWKSR